MPQLGQRAPTPLRVLVTGGTGTLGQAMVAAFAKAGHDVFFQYRTSDDEAAQLASRWSATAPHIDFSRHFAPPAVDVDVLVNNAATNDSDEETHAVDASVWDDMIRVNLTVPFLLIRTVLPRMVRQGWGRIVNIGSIHSIRAATHRAPYVASKHGLSGLTKTVAREYAEYGVTCNEICPSAVESRMVERLASDRARRQGRPVEELLDAYRAQSPAKRMATAEEVASVVLYLTTSEAAFVNGASIPVDGALLA
jgi:3-hydroxybutyrate dehydrogenase